jgi:alkylated DNA repair dioxygenase AlkB
MPPKTATPEERRRIESTIIPADPTPTELDVLLDRMIEYSIYTDLSRPEYCIVNEYKGSQGISAHVENFRFKSPVCGLTLCNGDYMRFRELTKPDDGSVRSGKALKAERTGKVVDVWMPRRSLIFMSGEAREKWQHEIVRGRKGRDGKDWRRVSLTFRTDKGSK